MSNLGQVRRARRAAAQAGVHMVMRGEGNLTTITFYGKRGRVVKVWYPDDGRGRDEDERQLEEVIRKLELPDGQW